MRHATTEGRGGAAGVPVPHPLQWLKDRLGGSR